MRRRLRLLMCVVVVVVVVVLAVAIVVDGGAVVVVGLMEAVAVRVLVVAIGWCALWDWVSLLRSWSAWMSW